LTSVVNKRTRYTHNTDTNQPTLTWSLLSVEHCVQLHVNDSQYNDVTEEHLLRLCTNLAKITE